MRYNFKKLVEDFRPDLKRFFKRTASYNDNGDLIEEIKPQSVEEYMDSCSIPSSPENFMDAVDRLPDVSLIDRFDAIDRLSAAIAGIEFSPSNISSDEM